MAKALKENKIIAALMISGLVCALILCGIRATAEFRNAHVCVVMSTGDMNIIQGELVGVRNYDGNTTIDGITLLIEDEVQYSYVNDIDAKNLDEAMARCFYLYPQFAARYNYLGYAGAEEIENILYRAVTDRNIRILWLTPFVDAVTGETITDAAVYNEVIENLSLRLARQGLTLGESVSSFGKYEPGAFYILLSAFAVAAAGTLLTCSLFSLSRGKKLMLLALCLLLSGALYIFDLYSGHLLFIPLFAFAASVVFPCLSMWYVIAGLAQVKGQSLFGELGAYARILLTALGISLAGALFIGALQSSSNYLLAINNFRGVKLSQMLPVAFAVYAVLRHLCPPREILAGKKFILALGSLLLVSGLIYYILRTGNSNVGVFEQRFRNWLEHLLIARPRTKEFLVAWPCLAIAFTLVVRRKKQYVWPFAILSSAGFASVVNTFCHSRAPLWLSLTRTLLGVLIGGATGCLIIWIMHKKSALPEQNNTR